MDERKEIRKGNKLKNRTTSDEAMRKKLRQGRADNKLTKEELRQVNKLKKQGRKKIYKETAVSATAHNQVANNNQDDNAGTESLNRSTQSAEEVIYTVKNHHYSNKLHERKVVENIVEEDAGKSTASNATSKAIQKKQTRKVMQERAREKQFSGATKGVGKLGQKISDKAGEAAQALMNLLKEHPMEVFSIAFLIIVILIVISSFSSCSMMGAGVQNVTVATSFTADDAEIIAVENDYKGLETTLQTTIDNVESDHPGYDEYRYTLAEIGHNPFQLAALLTVFNEDYTESEVQSMLQTVYNSQYTISIQEIVEVRTRTETRTGYRTIYNVDGTTSSESYTYQVEVEYNYYILQTTLTNNTLDTVIAGLGLTEDQMQRYALLLETYGNKPGIFGADIYSKVNPGDYQDYEIPPEALTDTKFANMIRVAEKYLGYPYVWGGSSPSTSFDCSGFVSYVINHCGNGWNMGRQTANGLLGKCTRISASEAKPGDLIFFQGTYDTSGASHVGIYVGNGMMIHCGNPIQYASVNTTYWQNHFYTYGRIN
ncbi:MAG: NlpC/P60 family protein [Lachnospiraceae bacterium]|nr:NlpC/P60 family protein [Lachnospiraceae bacterium]